MRPAGEVRQALFDAAMVLTTPERSPTLRELAERAQVGWFAASCTVKNMVRAGVLSVVRTRNVSYRNRPVAEYAPARAAERMSKVDTPPAGEAFAALMQCWTAETALVA